MTEYSFYLEKKQKKTNYHQKLKKKQQKLTVSYVIKPSQLNHQGVHLKLFFDPSIILVLLLTGYTNTMAKRQVYENVS